MLLGIYTQQGEKYSSDACMLAAHLLDLLPQGLSIRVALGHVRDELDTVKGSAC